MIYCRFSINGYRAGAIMLCLMMAAPATAARLEGDTLTSNEASATVQETGNPMTVMVNTDSADPSTQLDPRAKAAWLSECRRRANLNSTANSNRSEGAVSPVSVRSYDYCEAYLDDYYRNYAQPAVAYSYGSQAQPLPQPAQLARTMAAQQPYEEIITEEYVPVRSRNIVKRPIRDKRVKLSPR